jgi:hypothetical protein
MTEAQAEYWNGYNEGSKCTEKKEEVAKLLKEAQDEWNRDCDKGHEIEELEHKVITTAEEFFEVAGYINTDIIHAMITQL